MARFRKASPIKEHSRGILAGLAAGVVVILLICSWQTIAPAVRDFLPWTDGVAETESVAPAPEEAPPEEGAASSDSEGLGSRLWGLCKRFWPAVAVFVAVMEAAEYIGKFFLWLRKLFR